jgi:hypothetical protein
MVTTMSVRNQAVRRATPHGTARVTRSVRSCGDSIGRESHICAQSLKPTGGSAPRSSRIRNSHVRHHAREDADLHAGPSGVHGQRRDLRSDECPHGLTRQPGVNATDHIPRTCLASLFHPCSSGTDQGLLSRLAGSACRDRLTRPTKPHSIADWHGIRSRAVIAHPLGNTKVPKVLGRRVVSNESS